MSESVHRTVACEWVSSRNVIPALIPRAALIPPSEMPGTKHWPAAQVEPPSLVVRSHSAQPREQQKTDVKVQVNQGKLGKKQSTEKAWIKAVK